MTTTTITNKKIVLWVIPLFLFLILMLPNSLAVLSDAEAYYSFESFPSTTATDDSGNGYDITIHNVNMRSTFNKLGDWSLYSIYDASTPMLAYGNDVLPTNQANVNKSISAWIYMTNTGSSGYYNFFTYGSGTIYDGGGISARADSDGTIYIMQSIVLGSSTCAADNYELFELDTQISLNQYTHLVIVAEQPYDTNNAPVLTVYLNNVETNYTDIGGAGNDFDTGYEYGDSIIIGDIISPCWVDTGMSSYIDEFAVYNRTLSVSEIDSLYNGGYGYNPYDTNPPIQIASILTVSLGTFSNESRDYSDYFSGIENATITFGYELASYQADQYHVVNTGDFAIVFNDDTHADWYSYGVQVPTTAMNLSACNSNGCTNTTIYFEVSGFGIPTQITSIADWTINSGDTQYRTYSDYFTAYTRRFMYYTNPDTANQTIVSDGFPDINSCFDAQVTGDRAYITGKGNGCAVTDFRLVVDDELTGSYSNDFTLTIIPASAASSYFEGWLNFLPDADDISTGLKLLIVLFVVGLTVGVGAWMSSQSSAPTPIVFAIGLIVILEILFFTFINYLPKWLTIMLFFTVAIIGIGRARQSLVGSG